jgi:hypothetical protein
MVGARAGFFVAYHRSFTLPQWLTDTARFARFV